MVESCRKFALVIDCRNLIFTSFEESEFIRSNRLCGLVLESGRVFFLKMVAHAKMLYLLRTKNFEATWKRSWK